MRLRTKEFAPYVQANPQDQTGDIRITLGTNVYWLTRKEAYAFANALVDVAEGAKRSAF